MHMANAARTTTSTKIIHIYIFNIFTNNYSMISLQPYNIENCCVPLAIKAAALKLQKH